MCFRCDDVFATATTILDDLLTCRKQHGSDGTGAQNTTVMARVLIESLEPEEAGDNPFVQNLCLGLAVAVERLVALEEMLIE